MDFSGKFTFFFGRKKNPRLPSQGFQEIPAPIFSQRELRRCKCCTYPKRTIITLDPRGIEQYTCPVTKITMRLVDATQSKKIDPKFDGMYIQGGIKL